MDVYSWFRRRPQNSSTHRQDEHELFGVSDQLIDFIKTFTLDAFKNFPLPDENGTPATSVNIRNDLSDWQQRHAILVLSKAKELSQLRFRLCPRYLKEQQFWRIYFTLVKNIVAEYELRAVRLQKLKQMRVENGNENDFDKSAFEVEMSETKQVTVVPPATLVEHNLDSILPNSESRNE